MVTKHNRGEMRTWVYQGEEDEESGEQLSVHAGKSHEVPVNSALDQMFSADPRWKAKPRVGRPKGRTTAKRTDDKTED